MRSSHTQRSGELGSNAVMIFPIKACIRRMPVFMCSVFRQGRSGIVCYLLAQCLFACSFKRLLAALLARVINEPAVYKIIDGRVHNTTNHRFCKITKPINILLPLHNIILYRIMLTCSRDLYKERIRRFDPSGQSSISAASFIRAIMGRCCGHTLSHWPQPMQSDDFPLRSMRPA